MAMTARRSKKKVFSKVKAVKSTARERVGQPKPERIIEKEPREVTRKRKHKPTLQEIIDQME